MAAAFRKEGGRAGIAAFGCQTTDILQLHTSALGLRLVPSVRLVGGVVFLGGGSFSGLTGGFFAGEV